MGDQLKSLSFPSSLKLEYMGAKAPGDDGCGSLCDQNRINRFQQYRDDVIAKFQMAPYEWGMVDIPYCPVPNLTAAQKLRTLNRSLNLPVFPILTVDAQRQNEIDNFYKACQLHREQYRDNTGTLHPLVYFRPDNTLWQCPPDLTGTYLKHPNTYVQYKKPPVFPLTTERTMPTPYLPERSLAGKFYKERILFYRR